MLGDKENAKQYAGLGCNLQTIYSCERLTGCNIVILIDVINCELKHLDSKDTRRLLVTVGFRRPKFEFSLCHKAGVCLGLPVASLQLQLEVKS